MGDMQIPSFSLKSLQGASALFSNPTWDVMLTVLLVGGSLFWSFLAGRRKIVSTIMVTYIALAIFPAIPAARLTAMMGIRDQFLGTIGIFLILFILMVWLLGARRSRPFAPGAPWWQVFFLSVAQVGLLTHIILSLLPSAQTAFLSPLTRRVFVDPAVHLWWLVAPAVLLILIRRLAMRDE
ncbi:MAG: hypothetical protein A3C92_03065 [Candidatus Sungbacteria bacterium RIFCSPHIGHO2_02_FULL_53_17]|uniref:Uncharacterized protein n=2 Tax=Candidatus Sungiibacteriota TaxID=1817917 RepID=A0A1G2KW14_9BACT|nr:MAG: hypothetical protein A3C92_03065 [Candidatus Sungbacteria bacterium RIFCSPHIGHO2_02_FULL_53_17]